MIEVMIDETTGATTDEMIEAMVDETIEVMTDETIEVMTDEMTEATIDEMIEVMTDETTEATVDERTDEAEMTTETAAAKALPSSSAACLTPPVRRTCVMLFPSSEASRTSTCPETTIRADPRALALWSSTSAEMRRTP
jgi:predicted Zn-ribbon and HTH transcriptional regulator